MASFARDDMFIPNLFDHDDDLEDEQEDEHVHALEFATDVLQRQLRRDLPPELLRLLDALAPNSNTAALKETAAPSDGSCCPICLLDDEDDDDMAAAAGAWKETACRHRFHGPCVERWLRAKGSCPVCRRQLVKTPAPTTTAARADLDFIWNYLSGLYVEEERRQFPPVPAGSVP